MTNEAGVQEGIFDILTNDTIYLSVFIGGNGLFRKMTSKKEFLYLGVVVGITTGLFSATHSIIWLYLMALLIFLQGFIFGKPTKKNIIVDGVGLVLLVLIFTIGQHSF